MGGEMLVMHVFQGRLKCEDLIGFQVLPSLLLTNIGPHLGIK